MLFLLFYAGLEVNLSDLKVLGRRAVFIGLVGTLLPIAAGVGLVYALPRSFLGAGGSEHFLAFAVFIGMNWRTPPTRSSHESFSAATGGGVAMSIVLVGLLFVVILGFGRKFGTPALQRMSPHLSWPTGLVGVTALLVLIASSASEALGIHAFLGAFLVGVAFGDAKELQKSAYDTIGHFVMSFAPIYFISMGMTTNFITNFDLLLVLVILVVACISKVGSVLLGAMAARMPLDREAWALAFGLNARCHRHHPGRGWTHQRRHRRAHLCRDRRDGTGNFSHRRAHDEPIVVESSGKHRPLYSSCNGASQVLTLRYTCGVE